MSLAAPRSAAPGDEPAAVADIGAAFAADAAGLRRRLEREGARHDAEDLVQESFLRLLGRKGLQRPSAYAGRVALNLFRDHARRLMRRRQGDHVPLDHCPPLAGPDPHRQLEARDMLVRLEQAMLRLKPKTREIFMAHRLDGLTYSEIAIRTGLSVKAVEKQMSYAIARLADLMDRDR